MENYESLGTIGEGTYGVVLKCRHKVTGQIVAIKKFKESDDDEQVKKTALREIKILKQLKHENIVSLLEVFRVKGKLYLVFEFVEKTILEEIEKNPEGLEPAAIKRLMWQLVRAINFCHQHNIIHRDIKPENLLVSRNGVLKLCDFGFARPLASAGAKYTEYVSTRWYRAPELLVGDVSYGKAVDVWSIGCMFAEITTGLPLFPGDSDIDQLYHIIKCLGRITPRQQELFRKNSLYVGMKLPSTTEIEPLEARFSHFDKTAIDFLRQTIKDEPLDRWTCAELLKHPFFENATDQFEVELQEAIAKDLNDNTIKRKRNRKGPTSSEPSDGTAATSKSVVSSHDGACVHGDPGDHLNNSAATENDHGVSKSKMMPSSTTKDKLVASQFTNKSKPETRQPGLSSCHLPNLSVGNPVSVNGAFDSVASVSMPPVHAMMAGGDGYNNGKHRKLQTVANHLTSSVIMEDDPMETSIAMTIPQDHIGMINQYNCYRQSVTSHGGRTLGAPPRPPPSMNKNSNYESMQTTKRTVFQSTPGAMNRYDPSGGGGGGGGGGPYSVTTKTKGSNGNGIGGNGNRSKKPAAGVFHHHQQNGNPNGNTNVSSLVSCSFQNSMEVYSPTKRLPSYQMQMATPIKQKPPMDVTTDGIYIPPRTSQPHGRPPVALDKQQQQQHQQQHNKGRG